MGILSKSVHTKTTYKVEQAGTTWKELEPPKMSWKQIELTGAIWGYQRLALQGVMEISYSVSC